MEEKKNNQKSSINWFPGHMKKASIKIEEKMKYVDFVIVLIDARAPVSTLNNNLLKITKNKPKLFLLNKSDLALDDETNKWIKFFENNDNQALATNLNKHKDKETILSKIDEFCKVKEEKYAKKGIKNVVSRAMVIGIPNIGKSTFINLLVGKSVQGVQNTPGFTRSVTWAKVNKHFELLDTPGVLEPRFDKAENMYNLALIGAIKESILPLEEVTDYCLDYLLEYHKNALESRYNIHINCESNKETIFNLIAKSRGFLLKGNILDVQKARYILFKEFKEGLITRFTLEICKDA